MIGRRVLISREALDLFSGVFRKAESHLGCLLFYAGTLQMCVEFALFFMTWFVVLKLLLKYRTGKI